MRLLTFCFRNLFRRKTRTALCIVGVALAATFVIAVGATTMRYSTVIREMSVLFNGQVMVVDSKTIVLQAIPIGGGMLPEGLAAEIQENVTEADKAVPVLFLTPVDLGGILQPIPVNFSIGIPVQEWHAVLGPAPLKGNSGRFPINELSDEVVVGSSLADQYNWHEGARVMINGYELNVTGVLDTKLALLARSILMPLKVAQRIYTYPNSVNMIVVKPVQGFSEKDLAIAIQRQVTYVKALTEDERNDIILPVLVQVETFNIGMQAVVFVMSLILVMTVTLMSVSERRRDFATLDAIGAPLNYVFRTVIVETALIGVLGGVLGIVFGSLATLVLASLYTGIPLSLFFPSVFEVVPPLYMLEIFLSVVLVCTIGGILPATNAVRMRTAEVLRAEY